MDKNNHITLIADLDENGMNIAKCWPIADELYNRYGNDSIIFSSSPGLHLTVQAGFHSEYFPCYSSNGFDYELWNRWLQARILELCDAYTIGRIIYVGDRPPTGLLSAIDGLFQTRSVWVKSEEVKAGSAASSLAIHFDRVFEESAAPLKRGARLRRKGIFIPIPPIFPQALNGRQGARVSKSRSSNGSPPRPVLLQMGLGNTVSSRATCEFAQLLVKEDQRFKLHVQISDPEQLTVLADIGPATEKFLQTAETIRNFDFVILETADAASISTILSAGVPAIIMRGDPLQTDRIADFVLKEKVALVHDPASGLQPRKARALLRRIEAVRKILHGLALANGTEVLCRDLESAKDPA